MLLSLFQGESARTNSAGIAVLRDCFPDIAVTRIDIRGCDSLHLKSACSMAGDGHMLFGGEVGAYLQAAIAEASGNA
jgi:N-dimethylarginine dimethylaminohydrolase